MSVMDYTASTLRVGGESVLKKGTLIENGEEVYVIGRVRISEVSFKETDGGVKRVHTAKTKQLVIIEDSEAAEEFIADNKRHDDPGQRTIYDTMLDDQAAIVLSTDALEEQEPEDDGF